MYQFDPGLKDNTLYLYLNHLVI